MDPTTLVTFLFRAPAEARTVELLGSWDNFAQPYRMHNDRRRGIWSGIFRFENITFDGDDIQWTKPRSGGLRQGATYWYYYRLNSYDDTYDDRHPRTLSCPLIPGQVVNILEVPIELEELPQRCCSSSDIEGSLSNWQQLQTLDPATKYAMLEPPPASKIHARSLSDGTLQGRLENQPLSILEEAVSRPSTPELECHDSADRQDSRNGVSRDSSVYSQEVSCSAPVPKSQEQGERPPDLPSFNATTPNLHRIPELVEDSIPETIMPKMEPVSGDNAHLMATTMIPDLTRNLSALSVGPTSVQNIQFYNESRPGTRLNEDPEQYRPRVYSLPNSEVRNTSRGSPQLSPMSKALDSLPTNQYQHGGPSPDSNLLGLELESPSFSLDTASSAGEESPPHLSPRTSIKRDARPASRSGGALTGFANRIRSLRSRHHTGNSRPETAQSPRRGPPSFMNYALPQAVESSHSLTKGHSNISPTTRSAHDHMPMPTVFDAELPTPTLFSEERESPMADAIFSELGFLNTSIV